MRATTNMGVRLLLVRLYFMKTYYCWDGGGHVCAPTYNTLFTLFFLLFFAYYNTVVCTDQSYGNYTIQYRT